MTDYDYDYAGDLRPVLAEYDYDYPENEGPYLVQVWVYRYGFENKRKFRTQEEAEHYAHRKAMKTKGRYRVLGPTEEES